MLTELRLQNYRCFEDHTIPLRPTTIIVGRNNAGKSSIVEALRILSIVVNRLPKMYFKKPPEWLGDIPLSYSGIEPSLWDMEFNFRTIFHRYSDPPAIITAIFDNKFKTEIYVGPEGKVHAVFLGPDGKVKASTKEIKLSDVSILPQVGPLAREEVILERDYVQRAMSSYLAPLHFRNQLNVLYEKFNDFKKMSEETWSGLRIRNLDGKGGLHKDSLSLYVQDGDFVSEVALMGHGLQMWLQTMWFLTRVKNHETVILDEPDVYMHADLQRKLIRFLRRRRKQIIIATHSIEIMAEVEPDNILVVEKRNKKSTFATSLPAVQTVIDNIGGVHNIHLSRLWTARRCLFIEGKDVALLKNFQNKIFPDSDEPFDHIPNMSIGGWSGWHYAVASSKFIRKNAGGENISTYCILDSDYNTRNEKKKRLEDATERGIRLHIWERKEIENYLILPKVIERIISSRIAKGITPPTGEEIEKEVDKIAYKLHDDVLGLIASKIHTQNKGKEISTTLQEARKAVDKFWGTSEGRLSIVSGKEVLSQLSKWSQERYKVSFSPEKISYEIHADEIPVEVVSVVRAIEEIKSFV